NRFDFPGDAIQLDEYFRLHTEIPETLPQVMDGFFLRHSLPIKEIMATAVITQTAGEPKSAEKRSVIFDIDLFPTNEIPGEDFWPVFDLLRTWKNKIFEECITEKTRELIR